MVKLKGIDYKILAELIRNAKVSDRQLAKKIGISQPTVTRRRAGLEKDLIAGYTAVPKWEKLGFQILAITLIKATKIFSSKEYSNIREQGLDWLAKQPHIIMGGACEGMGMNSFMISLHESFSDHSKFLLKLRLEMGDFIDDVHSVLVDLKETSRLKPLHLEYLADAKLLAATRAHK
jgi:DNA-binding Lrp family transcriptional regulator